VKITVTLLAVILITGCARYRPAERPELTEPELTPTITYLDETDEATAEQEKETIRSDAEAIDEVEARVVGENIILTVGAHVLFPTLSAEVKESAYPVLDEVAKLLLDYPDRMVMVAGHADTQPVMTERFPSNWDLSAQRAVNVVKYIRHLPELDVSRLIAAGFGEHHPVAPNDSPENRRLNRRVEFILLPRWEKIEEIRM